MPDDAADDHQSFRQQRALQDLVIGAQLGCFDIVDTDEPWQIVSLLLREPDRHVSDDFSRHIARCRTCCVFVPRPTHACGLDQCVSGPAAGRCRPCLVPAAARALADWLISADGQAAIGALRDQWRAAVPPPRPRRRNNLQLLCLGFGPGLGTGPGERANTFLILREFSGSPRKNYAAVVENIGPIGNLGRGAHILLDKKN